MSRDILAAIERSRKIVAFIPPMPDKTKAEAFVIMEPDLCRDYLFYTRNVHGLLLDIAETANSDRQNLLDRLLHHGSDEHRAWLRAEVDYVFCDLDRALQVFAGRVNDGH